MHTNGIVYFKDRWHVCAGKNSLYDLGVDLIIFTEIDMKLGMGSAEVTVPITLLLVKELNVLGSFRYGVCLMFHKEALIRL